MPESPDAKPVAHPWKAEAPERDAPPRPPGADALPFAELLTTSNYTFLTGGSFPEEFVKTAAGLGYRAVGVADLHSVAGIVRAHVAAKEAKIKLLVGARVRPTDRPGLTLALYPMDLQGYRRLCRLLTLGKRRAPKGECHLRWEDVSAYAEGLQAVVLLEAASPESAAHLREIAETFNGGCASLALTMHYRYDAEEHAAALADLARSARLPLIATNDALYHHPGRRPLQDVLTCIRCGCTLEQAGFRLEANAERHLKAPDEMHRLFRLYPDAIRRGLEVAGRCQFSLDELRYRYPDEVVPAGVSAIDHLRALTWSGAAERYPAGVPEKVRKQLDHELGLIGELNRAHYFLTVHELVHFARSRGILCQGRGAAANSAVCYCLGVTGVDPSNMDLLFERFMSKERDEPPDIDIDFEHERREEVIQHIYEKYGRDRAALTAEVISYRARSAVRDVGKALGFSLDVVDRLAKGIEWFDKEGATPKRLRAAGLDPAAPATHWLMRLTLELQGFPRHLSQHVGGFVIANGPLCELVPIENAAMEDRTVIEWDKDDIDAVGMMKVDCLGLGMLTCLRKCMELCSAHGGNTYTLASIPPEDTATYDMICRADTIGVFQIESRAQMSMLPRLRPRTWYDLVIEVAIVRPGPIQGDMVHPYLRRRSGEAPVTYPHPAVEKVLKRTLGVPLFQEQCMALAIEAAGFTPGEADQLRRAMAAWKRKGDLIYRFGQKIIDGMTQRGIDRAFAERCFEQIKGFSEYGFPESHAASFAHLVYASCYLKKHYPAHFACALLNSQPMGFYQPAQIVRDAIDHGVKVLPVDVNHSAWDCTLEGYCGQWALRLGMRQVSGMREPEAGKIAAAVKANGPFTTPLQLFRRSGCTAKSLRLLAGADAFGSMGLDRRAALWAVRAMRDGDLPLFAGVEQVDTDDAVTPDLPAMPPREAVLQDYGVTGLSLKAHPISFERGALTRAGVTPCGELRDASRWPQGKSIRVAGVVLVRQRPGTASGTVFITLEDETGIANLIVWPRVYERFRRVLSRGAFIARGKVERQGEVVHVVLTRALPLESASAGLSLSRDFH